MEGTIGEIRLFASNFAPRSWAFCQGQMMSIASNTALYAILGNVYGGDGKTTFVLPNLTGRSALGAGQGNGLSAYRVGEVKGTETVTLTSGETPAHNHGVTVQPGSGGSANAVLFGVNAPGTSSSPGGNILAEDSIAGMATYASSGTLVNMKSGSVAVTSVNAPLPTVTIGSAGNNMYHNNMQPFLGLYYVICTHGTFPPRP